MAHAENGMLLLQGKYSNLFSRYAIWSGLNAMKLCIQENMNLSCILTKLAVSNSATCALLKKNPQQNKTNKPPKIFCIWHCPKMLMFGKAGKYATTLENKDGRSVLLSYGKNISSVYKVTFLYLDWSAKYFRSTLCLDADTCSATSYKSNYWMPLCSTFIYSVGSLLCSF